MPRGAKEKLTKPMIKEATRLKKAGVNHKDIAAYIGVAPQTLSTWIHHPRTKNQKEFAEAMKKTEADYKASLLAIIYNNAKKQSWQAAAWLLERKYPEEFARQDRTQVDAKVEAAPKFFFDRKDAENDK